MFKQNQWSAQINGGYNQPLGEMGNWLKPTYNIAAGFSYGFSARIAGEWRLHFTDFDKTGEGGGSKYPIPAGLDVSFRSVGLTASALLNLATDSNTKPYIIFGFGIYRWENYRGSGVVNKVNILAKSRGEYSMGFNGGIGLAIAVGRNAYFDINIRWEGIMETLYPTLWLGLERVQPVQFVGINAGMRFLL